jgi:hypothetical protein
VRSLRAVVLRRRPGGFYEEREESRARRQVAIDARKALPEPAFGLRGRPTKRDRRMMKRLMGD